MALEQFEKSLRYYARNDLTKREEHNCQRLWEMCLTWVMKRGMHHYGNDFLTDMDKLSREIRIELGELDKPINKYPKPLIDKLKEAGFDLADGCRPLCHSICSNEQRVQCNLSNDPMSIESCAPEKILIREEDNPVDNICVFEADKSTPEEMVPVNKAERLQTCKHAGTCPRKCRHVEPFDERWCPVWLQPADGHNSEGWVPCDKYINLEDTKKFHCAHVVLNRRGNFLMDGYELVCCLMNLGQKEPKTCKGYSQCDKYAKGNEI